SGRCRTEHMSRGGGRAAAARTMIFADTAAGEEEAYAALLPLQRGDFVGIFEAMDGLPVTVRLLDPPLHEFLPNHVDMAVAVALAEERGDTEVVVRDEKISLEEAREILRKVEE